MTFTQGAFNPFAVDLRPDQFSQKIMQDRLHKLNTDPAYRARQRLRAQIGQSNSVAARGKRNVAVSLPKFSWDEK